MAMRGEIDPLTFSREDEANGGLIPGRFTRANGAMRKKGRTAGGNHDKLTMAQMKARMASLWRDGETYAEIAATVSDEYLLEGENRIHANGIHYHIKNMLAYWREKGLVTMDERQAMILARYDQIEMLATEAYFASCEGTTTRNFKRQIERAKSKEREKALLKSIKKSRREQNGKVKTHEFGDLTDTMGITAEKTERYVRREARPAGDPRFLQILIDINYKRSQLWGLLNKSDMANPDQELARLPDDVREQRIAAILQQAQARRNQTVSLLAPPSPLGGFKEGEEPKHRGPIEPEVLPPDEGWDINSDEDEDEWQ